MRVACVLIPSFAVRLERRDAPVLRETALIVGGAPHQRQVVQDCSSAATRAGVQPGMPLRRALALCRDARFVEARPLLYAETVEALREVLELIAPRVEVEPAETAAQVCFFLDVAGMERLWPEEEALATDIVMAVRRVCRLTPRVAIADGRATARAAARAAVRKDEGGRIKDECDAVTTSSLILPPSSFRIIPPGAALSFLAALPLDAIALPHGLQAELQLLGIRTLGALAALPSGAVAARFGPAGMRAWETARGIDTHPFSPRIRHAAVSDELELPAPTTSQEAILAAARILLRRLLRRPEVGNRLVRRLFVHTVGEMPGEGAHAPDAPALGGEGSSFSFVLRDPTADPERMLFLFRNRLEGTTLPGPVQRVRVTLAEFCGERGRQEGLFASKGRRTAQLEESIRQLHSRYGRSPILRLVPVEPWSRIPERRMALATYEC